MLKEIKRFLKKGKQFDKTDLLFDLTNEQKKAVLSSDKYIQIVAGPGTGKTKTLTHKVAYIIEEKGVKPEEILMVTFTNKAADEMKLRISKLVSKDVSPMFVGTIDSFCETIINQFGSENEFSNFKILDEFERFLFIKKHINKLIDKEKRKNNVIFSKAYSNFSKFVLQLGNFYDNVTQNLIEYESLVDLVEKDEKWLEEIYVFYKKKLKNKQVNINQKTLIKSKEDKNFENNVKEFLYIIFKSYEVYINLLKKEFLLDFSLLEKETFRIVNNNIGFFNKYTQVFIDEFQDINPLQWKIFSKIISSSKSSLTVVGDKNQAIYGFRGSNPNIFDKIKNEYEVKELFLEKNFRSEKNIVKLANEIISDKSFKLKSNKNSQGIIFLEESEYEDESAKKILEFIKKLKENKSIESYSDVAILLRSVRSHGEVFFKLLKKNYSQIPYIVYGTTYFFENKEIQSLLFLMDYVLGSSARIIYNDFLRVDNLKDALEIFSYKLNKKNNVIEELKSNLQDKIEKNSRIQLLEDVLYPILSILRININIDDRIMQKNIAKLTSIILSFETINATNNNIQDYFESFISTINYLPENLSIKIDEGFSDKNNFKLNFMTVHQAKGLEFPIVIIPSLVENRFPSSKKTSYLIPLPENILLYEHFDEMKEEKNLFFVASSRAESALVLSTFEYKSDGVKKLKKSRFLKYLKKVKYEKLDKKETKIKIDKKEEKKNFYHSFKVTEIKTFVDCQERFKLNYDYKYSAEEIFEQKIGLIYHNALAKIHREYKKDKNKFIKVDEIVESVWENLGRYNETLKKKFVKSLKRYVIWLKSNVEEILDYEKSISIVEKDYEIKGKIDLIIKDKKGKINILDFKTREKKSIEETHVDLQTYIYKKGLEKEGIKVNSCYAMPLLDKFFEPVKIEYKDNKFKEIMKELKNSIKEEKYTFTEDSEFCKKCPYRLICKKYKKD